MPVIRMDFDNQKVSEAEVKALSDADMKSRIGSWKKETGFGHMINFTFIPMDWKIEIGI